MELRAALVISTNRTQGYASWIGQYAERNASLVDILYEAGAVPFVRTNVPQTLMVAVFPL